MQYDERLLAQLAAKIAAALIHDSGLLEQMPEREKVRAGVRDVARLSVMTARHVLVASRVAAAKTDELELLYDDADFL